ncbi:fluoride efflux transporter CrcB [Akkermansiaceae bacterium]|nr:fluoride efflux transporter CrcB [Akkermansiaceae bacterium]
MMHALLIFFGGGLGSLARWSLSLGVQQVMEKTALQRFPIGIFTCNILGCFLIGCLFGYFTNRNTPEWVFPFLATGFLGGFTTFSTFAQNGHELWTSGMTGAALIKLIGSVVIGVIAVWAGIKLTHTA